ncbi:MAG: glycosyltransferase, partial [Patescibacteria group bacterium]
MTPYLSVIIPAYNEEDNLNRGTLDVAVAYLEKQPYPWEIVLVNDGSSDKTAEILKDFAQYQKHVRFIDNPHQGKAQTVITGVLAAQGEIILFSDMDQATPITEFDKFLPKFEEGAD